MGATRHWEPSWEPSALERCGRLWTPVDPGSLAYQDVWTLLDAHGRRSEIYGSEGWGFESLRARKANLASTRERATRWSRFELGHFDHRRLQAEERLAAGPQWEDNDLVLATRTGRVVSPRNFDTTFARLVAKADVPRLSSHGLRHTAATHMVRHASDIGEIRAAADILGHSPDMLMKTYAHVLLESVRAITEKIAKRGSTPPPSG